MKRQLNYILVLMMAFMSINTFAQNAHFVQNGIIEFEKKSNSYAIIKRNTKGEDAGYVQTMIDSYKKNNPQFKVEKSTLSFTREKSLYKWTNTDMVNVNWIAREPLADLKNIIATNFNTQSSITQKDVYDDLFLVKDSVRKINWKITDETREIAGYDCRRANAIIMDSIYVVAYYSNQIAVSGEPESFTGLPGMILGVAMPHENLTWFATKVTEVAVSDKELLPPTKGKQVTQNQLKDILLEAMKDWGKYGKSQLKGYLF
ncbi:GLPGLI family protein [Pedobacter sp. MW01-1-1]|uniref:GLPGLI family protein n=1 Tax=Pedobacter sp. MW01-1-1 TaxID=3383027 RepID=UPI003FF0AA04